MMYDCYTKALVLLCPILVVHIVNDEIKLTRMRFPKLKPSSKAIADNTEASTSQNIISASNPRCSNAALPAQWYDSCYPSLLAKQCPSAMIKKRKRVHVCKKQLTLLPIVPNALPKDFFNAESRDERMRYMLRVMLLYNYR